MNHSLAPERSGDALETFYWKALKVTKADVPLGDFIRWHRSSTIIVYASTPTDRLKLLQ